MCRRQAEVVQVGDQLVEEACHSPITRENDRWSGVALQWRLEGKGQFLDDATLWIVQ